MKRSLPALTALLLGACSPASPPSDVGEPNEVGEPFDVGPIVLDGGTDAAPRLDAGPLPPVDGHAYYTFGNDVFRIGASAGAAPENLSDALDALGVGARDRRITASANGAYLVLSAEGRAGCSGECLIRVPADLSRIDVVAPGGESVSPEGIAAIDTTGDVVVYPATGGPHAIDLFVTRRSGGTWGAPTLLTGSSTYAYNNMPALSGTRVTFDCGVLPYPEDGMNDACEVSSDGTGFHRSVGPDTLPGARENKVQNPHLGPDGLLFEASWPIEGDAPEAIWLLPNEGGDPTPIGRALPNSVSPCALSDGRFLLLWLGRAENTRGAHELTLVARDGTLLSVLTPDVDVDDIGIGCSD